MYKLILERKKIVGEGSTIIYIELKIAFSVFSSYHELK